MPTTEKTRCSWSLSSKTGRPPERKAAELTLLSLRQEADGYYRLVFDNPIGPALPGQFLMIAPTDCGDPYLKRPISVLWADENSIELLVAVKGRGTKMLVERPIGAKLPAVGFLGKPFPKPLEPDGHAFLVGGGVGVPPMYMLARALREDGFEGKITAVIGARTCSAVLLAADFAKYSDVVCATDDGSEGEKGNAAQVFEKTVEKTGVKSATAYACGPLPMMKGVAKAAAARGFSVWVSLEERMGCGTGVCMGCSAAMKSGKYARVCTEGAVFSAYDVEGFIE